MGRIPCGFGVLATELTLHRLTPSMDRYPSELLADPKPLVFIVG